MRIFVSYTTRDSYLDRERLSDIDRVASKFGCVFVDVLHNDSLNRQERVKKELISASVVLFIGTSGCAHSEWVGWERHKASEHGKECLEVTLDETGLWSVNLEKIDHALTERSANRPMHTDGNSVALHSRR